MTQLTADDPRPLSDLERRTLAHLAIPRNVHELGTELRQDRHTRVPDGTPEGANFMGHPTDVQTLLERAEAQGLAVNLGEHSDPAKLAATSYSSKGAYPWHDESREIYARRLTDDRHVWRREGDLWLLTQDGLDALRVPAGPVGGPMTPSEVQAAVDAEWERTIKDKSIESFSVDDSQTTPLMNALLADEFMGWFEQVADECERVWGKGTRPRAPMAGGAGWTDVFENRILDHENQKTAMPALVAPWFMCLVILALTDTDTPTTARDGSHIPTYTGYAEKSVAAADMPAAASGSSANTTAIVFAACTAGSSTILGAGNKETNGTTGDLRKYGTTASTTVSTTQTPPQFAIGAYTTTAD